MGRIMIRCPKTQKPIPTGIGAGNADILKNGTFSNNSVTCPECEGTHTWSGPDAFYEE